MKVSEHFKNRTPSSIRKAQISFSERHDKDSVVVINLAIGNISRPMYPAMRKALFDLGTKRKSDGVVKYTPTVGTDKARNAFLNIFRTSILVREDEKPNRNTVLQYVMSDPNSAPVNGQFPTDGVRVS